MSFDIQYTKIETFADVNDTPVLPTITSAGNGSHLISQHNDLVDEVESNINGLNNDVASLQSKVAGAWIATTQVDYYAEPGDRIVFLNYLVDGIQVYKLYLPNTPPIGSTVTFMATTNGEDLEIRNFGQFNYDNNLARLYVRDAYIERTLVYIGFPYGWISTSSDSYLTVRQE